MNEDIPFTETVDVSIDNGIARIALNRPERLNALTRQMMLELKSVIGHLVHDSDVRVILLTGNGRGFCAGQDLAERDPRELDGPLDLEQIQSELFHPIVRSISSGRKPVVAVVNGVAAGAGAALALSADIVLAGKSAVFAFSFARVGLSVDAGLGRALVQGLGAPRARALLMLGESLTATHAAEAGLIWQALPDEALAGAADELVKKLAATARHSLSGIKQATAAAHLPLEEYLAFEAHLQGIAGKHEDYAEGVLAFLERRPPLFS